MIKLFDRYNEGEDAEFRLLSTRAKDKMHYATRRDIRTAIDCVMQLSHEDQYDASGPVVRLMIKRNNSNDEAVTAFLEVGVTYQRGMLHLGCHTFGRETSKKIIRWA
jgi:hypothetical protein